MVEERGSAPVKPPVAVENTDGTQTARLPLEQGRVDTVVQSSELVP